MYQDCNVLEYDMTEFDRQI